MKNNVHLSDQATADLDDISNYITGQLNNPIAANRTVNGIIHAMEQLEIFSGAGSIVYFSNGSDSGYRFVMYRNYMIFYRVFDTEVYIDRIIYGKRNYMEILFDME